MSISGTDPAYTLLNNSPHLAREMRLPRIFVTLFVGFCLDPPCFKRLSLRIIRRLVFNSSSLELHEAGVGKEGLGPELVGGAKESMFEDEHCRERA